MLKIIGEQGCRGARLATINDHYNGKPQMKA